MKSLELFAGAGGLALGVCRAGFTHLAINEIDEKARQTIRRNSDWPFQDENIHDARMLDYRPLKDKIDLISAGPPCQPFSIAGQNRGYVDPRDMFPEAIRAIRHIQPNAFIIENVKGLKRPSLKEYFTYIILQLTYPNVTSFPGEGWVRHMSRLQALKDDDLLIKNSFSDEVGITYHVTHKTLNAADFGVAQKRERVFIVGTRPDRMGVFQFPQPTHSRDALLWSKWVDGTYWDRHGIDVVHHEKEEEMALKIKEKPDLLAWRTIRDCLIGLPRLDDIMAGENRYADHDFIKGAKIYKGHTGSLYDEVAKTLKAGVHGVPGGENILREEDGSVRYFTIREAARLQGFPDDFLFDHLSWSQAMHQIGNAVPVPMAYAIAHSLHRQMQEMSCDNDSQNIIKEKQRI